MHDVATISFPSVEPLWSYKDGSLPPTCSIRVPHLVSTLHTATPFSNCLVSHILCFHTLHSLVAFLYTFCTYIVEAFFTTAFFLCTSIMLLSTLLHTCTIIANNGTRGFVMCVWLWRQWRGGHYRFECRPVIMVYLVSMCCSMPYCEWIATGALNCGTSNEMAFGQGGEGWAAQHMGRCNVCW